MFVAYYKSGENHGNWKHPSLGQIIQVIINKCDILPFICEDITLRRDSNCLTVRDINSIMTIDETKVRKPHIISKSHFFQELWSRAVSRETFVVVPVVNNHVQIKRLKIVRSNWYYPSSIYPHMINRMDQNKTNNWSKTESTVRKKATKGVGWHLLVIWSHPRFLIILTLLDVDSPVH